MLSLKNYRIFSKTPGPVAVGIIQPNESDQTMPVQLPCSLVFNTVFMPGTYPAGVTQSSPTLNISFVNTMGSFETIGVIQLNGYTGVCVFTPTNGSPVRFKLSNNRYSRANIYEANTITFWVTLASKPVSIGGTAPFEGLAIGFDNKPSEATTITTLPNVKNCSSINAVGWYSSGFTVEPTLSATCFLPLDLPDWLPRMGALRVYEQRDDQQWPLIAGLLLLVGGAGLIALLAVVLYQHNKKKHQLASSNATTTGLPQSS